MARRKSFGKAGQPAKPKVFDAAFGQIDKLEQAVCYRAVTRGYTLDDVCEYLWEPNILATLRAAFPLAADRRYSGTFFDPSVPLNGLTCAILVNTNRARMLMPTRGLIAEVIERPSTIMDDIRVLNDTHRKFQRVRNVVNWLTDHATPMAARYYFPSMGALLPSDHKFHTYDGLKSAGCKGNIAEIADDMRDAAQTIATGLLCEPDKVNNEAGVFTVRIITDEGRTAEGCTSNEFALI